MALAGGLTGIGGPLVTLKKPLIAAVQGFCVGGGFELAMCADIIVAADTAQFGLPETKVGIRSEEHTSELQSLMRISYAVFCLKKKINTKNNNIKTST